MTPTLEEQLVASLALLKMRKPAAECEELALAEIRHPLILMPSPASPPPDSEIPARLSPSSVNCFLDCSARWYYRKVLKIPERRGAALGLGTAVHAALIGNFRQKIDSKRDLSVRDTQAIFIDALIEQLDEIKLLQGESADDLKEAGEAMVAVYMDQAAPQVEPAAIEEHVEGEIGGVPVHGYIDIRTIQGRVIDIKTAKKKPAGMSVAHKLQVTTYVMLDPDASGEATISTLTKTRTVALQQDSVSILPPEVKLAERLYSIARDQMQTGLVIPNRASFLCGKYCSFRGRCLDDYGGAMPAEASE